MKPKKLKTIKNKDNKIESFDGKIFNATIEMIIRSFFDYLCSLNGKLNIEDIKILSYITQKLMYCYATFRSVEIRLAEHKVREEETELRKEKIRETLHVAKKQQGTLSPETLEYIEENLRFI